jgi:hypothetical protein
LLTWSSPERNAAVVALAKSTVEKEGEIEIDEDAKVSEASDVTENGAYVQAWVWIPFAETSLTKADPYAVPF